MPKIKILLADDDPDIRLIYSVLLEQYYDVTLARDGAEAWKLFQETRPRLVVADLNMPGLNGLEFTEKIRGHPELAKTPVIIVTGTTAGTDLPPGFWKIGTAANRMMEKPVTPDELLEAIRRELLIHAKANPLPPGKGYYDIEKKDDAGPN